MRFLITILFSAALGIAIAYICMVISVSYDVTIWQHSDIAMFKVASVLMSVNMFISINIVSHMVG